MNLVCIGLVGRAVVFKYIGKQGVSIVDQQLFRNIALLALSIIMLIPNRINPIAEFPSKNKGALLARIVGG